MHIWKHFSTITRHRHKVIVHCFMAGIFWQGLRHDLSKYSPAEFIPGAKNYLGDKSPNEKERERYGFSLVGVARPDYYREGKTSGRRNITCGFC